MTRVFIALGANLPSPRFGTPEETLEAAVAELEGRGVEIIARSRWYESAPVPASDQPWFVNGVIEAETDLQPSALLGLLHEIEADFGRVRREKWEARAIDLDLISCGDIVSTGTEGPALPHPRMHKRRFVLEPLADIDPAWVHPAIGRTVKELLDELDKEQIIRPLADRRT